MHSALEALVLAGKGLNAFSVLFVTNSQTYKHSTLRSGRFANRDVATWIFFSGTFLDFFGDRATVSYGGESVNCWSITLSIDVRKLPQNCQIFESSPYCQAEKSEN
jgi:hypothetical protein